MYIDQMFVLINKKVLCLTKYANIHRHTSVIKILATYVLKANEIRNIIVSFNQLRHLCRCPNCNYDIGKIHAYKSNLTYM